jgi:hypothetical protein
MIASRPNSRRQSVSHGGVASAGTGARTRMGLPPRDFKSLASAYFATPATPFSKC